VEVAPAECDVALYHLGNNGLHRDIYRRALEKPGVAVLHDACCTISARTTGRSCVCGGIRLTTTASGTRSGAELWRGRASSGSDRRYFDYPMLRRIVERSRAVVVHNPAAARVAAEHVPQARVVEIRTFS